MSVTEKIIVAGLLHDTVEDTSVTLEDIRKSFGETGANLVNAASESWFGKTGQVHR